MSTCITKHHAFRYCATKPNPHTITLLPPYRDDTENVWIHCVVVTPTCMLLDHYTDNEFDTHYLFADPGEFLQIPSGYFDHTVIQTRFKAGCRGIGNWILQLRKSPTKCQLGSDVSEWVPCSLTGQSWTSRQSSVHFYYVILKVDKEFNPVWTNLNKSSHLRLASTDELFGGSDCPTDGTSNRNNSTTYLLRLWIQCVLYIALADDAQMTNDFNGRCS